MSYRAQVSPVGTASSLSQTCMGGVYSTPTSWTPRTASLPMRRGRRPYHAPRTASLLCAGNGVPTIKPRGAFTLIEIMIASIAAVMILAAIYGIFSQTMKMRDNATNKIREARLKARAVNVIRNDLRNALVSGGIMAATLAGGSTTTDGSASFPGYLKLTTTTGKDNSSEMYGDVQSVEYYVVREPGTSSADRGGTLLRIITRDLLDANPTVTHVEEILAGVESFHVSFYDGATWQPSWQVGGTSAATTSGTASTSGTSNPLTLPAAVRIDIQQSASKGKGQAQPAPVEIVMPWTTTPFISGTNFVIGSGTNG